MDKPFLKLPASEDGTPLGLVVAEMYSGNPILDKMTCLLMARALQAHGEAVREACVVACEAMSDSMTARSKALRDDPTLSVRDPAAMIKEEQALVCTCLADEIRALDVSVEA